MLQLSSAFLHNFTYLTAAANYTLQTITVIAKSEENGILREIIGNKKEQTLYFNDYIELIARETK